MGVADWFTLTLTAAISTTTGVLVGTNSSTADLVARVSPAVVKIEGTTATGDLKLGTGFVVDGRGIIVTNCHVIAGLQSVVVSMPSGDKYDHVQVRSIDARRDLALIEIDGFNLPTLACGNSDSVVVGQSVLLIGSPLGLGGTVSKGVVSSIRLLDSEGYRVIQTDAAASPGSSGGPLVDESGRVVGVLAFKAGDGENLNFTIPINYVRGMLRDSTRLTLAEASQRIGSAEDVRREPRRAIRWKSTTGGETMTARRVGDYLYFENVLSEEAASAGYFILAEFKVDSAGRPEAGEVRGRLPCPIYDGIGGAFLGNNACTYTVDIRIDVFGDKRIEGVEYAYPRGGWRCKQCEPTSKPVPRKFVWVLD